MKLACILAMCVVLQSCATIEELTGNDLSPGAVWHRVSGKQAKEVAAKNREKAIEARGFLEEAWEGRPESEVIGHPFFRSITRSSLPLTDGSATHKFTSSTPYKCETTGYAYRHGSYGSSSATTRCGHSAICHHHFTIRNGIVESMELDGDCSVDSRKWPLAGGDGALIR